MLKRNSKKYHRNMDKQKVQRIQKKIPRKNMLLTLSSPAKIVTNFKEYRKILKNKHSKKY